MSAYRLMREPTFYRCSYKHSRLSGHGGWCKQLIDVRISSRTLIIVRQLVWFVGTGWSIFALETAGPNSIHSRLHSNIYEFWFNGAIGNILHRSSLLIFPFIEDQTYGLLRDDLSEILNPFFRRRMYVRPLSDAAPSEGVDPTQRRPVIVIPSVFSPLAEIKN